ncbi:MAG TPA: YggS family pyridoxal phosphate-dependent enzyme [Chloroflexota bacterium]
MLSASTNLASNLARMRDQIAEAAARVGRNPADIRLVAVTKTHPVDVIVEAARGGLEHIGENRVQEAAAKLPEVRQAAPDVVCHLIGHLQTNKAAAAIELFDRIDSVDSLHLAQALSKRLHGSPHADLPILLEIYVGDDPARPGLRPDGLVDSVGPMLALPGLRVEGVMTVAPLGADARAAFAQVRSLKETLASAFPRVHFGVLSMGMSDDFMTAIEEGSTEVRIGSALFGPRRTA